jgi:Putative Actinobacterial Holin-X, holin superfamily III
MMPDHDSDHRDSPASLVSDAVAGFGRLVEGELRLARAEVRQAVKDAQRGLVRLAVAAVLAVAGLNVLAAAAVAGLVAAGLGAAAAGLIVALATLAIAVVLVLSARSSLDPARFWPRRALHGLRRDAKAVSSAFHRPEAQDA